MRIPVAKPVMEKEELENVMNAVKSGWIGRGDFIKKFEKGFAKYNGCNYGVSTMNGTVAIHLALELWRIDHEWYCGYSPCFSFIRDKKRG